MGDVIFTNKNRFPYIINQSGFLINIISDKKINNNCVFLVHQLTPTSPVRSIRRCITGR